MDEQVARKEKLIKEIKGMAFGAAGIFFLIALLSFHADDASFNSFSSEAGVHNLAGRLGPQFADLLLQVCGLAAYLVPGTLLFLSYRLLRFKEIKWRYYKGVAFVGLLVSLSA